jgi:CheY-like chemotaxis protein
LILLDVMMPGVNRQLTKQALAESEALSATPVAVLSALQDGGELG